MLTIDHVRRLRNMDAWDFIDADTQLLVQCPICGAVVTNNRMVKIHVKWHENSFPHTQEADEFLRKQ